MKVATEARLRTALAAVVHARENLDRECSAYITTVLSGVEEDLSIVLEEATRDE